MIFTVIAIGLQKFFFFHLETEMIVRLNVALYSSAAFLVVIIFPFILKKTAECHFNLSSMYLADISI